MQTSWHRVGKWYDRTVGESGHYYHVQVILPGVKRLLDLKTGDSILDLACGQGVLAGQVPTGCEYWGVDMANSLIKAARDRHTGAEFHFVHADATKTLPVQKKDFSHAAVILALQNMDNPEAVVKNAAQHLQPQGKLVVVINHPCFRIPRQSSWGIDEQSKLQYRRINQYMSPLKIPVNMTPGKGGKGELTWSFHYPLSTYFDWLAKAGFTVENLEEWGSDKVSEGRAAKMENRSRKEIPLFMAISARKNN